MLTTKCLEYIAHPGPILELKKKHFYISSSNRHQFTSKPSMYFDVENLDELVMLP